MKRTGAWIAIMLSAFAAVSVQANPLEKLLMPGELTSAHAEFESDCTECHDRTDKSRQRQLCLDCHEDVAADVKGKTGFHGRRAQRAQCNACHSEHQGRGADIVHLDKGSFDHRHTDFELTGAHVAAGCDSCHESGRKFSEAPQQCFDCHEKDDSHRGKLGQDCAQCHETTGFRQTKFDHSKTRFPLTNAHGKVACGACHRDASFKGAPLRCIDCHASDDVHRGSRGADCSACHGTADWKQSKFDHFKATGYALEGKHSALACDTCHRGGDLKAELPKQCSGCHAAADSHSGRFGTACADCHGQQQWPIERYDHEKHNQFALRGAHAELGCHACHSGVIKQQQMAKDCYGCHAADDVHATSMGKACRTCHNETGWRDNVRFDHDFAGFPLVGLHVGVPCEECHVTRAYREAPVECVACHRAKDAHEGELGEQCDSCHNPNGWDFWQFDHGRQTKFALDGAHADLGCRDCHRDSTRAPISMECGACHLRDDVHDGRFGRDCGRCHTTDTFRHAAMN